MATRRDYERIAAGLLNVVNVTFYGAAYHALAIVNQGVFITADEKYMKAVCDEPYFMHIKNY